MKKVVFKKQSRHFQFLWLILLSGAIIYFSLIGLVVAQDEEVVDDLSMMVSQYELASQRVAKLIKDFPRDIFQHPLLKKLEHSFKLPLTVSPGKENPFAIPLPPEQLLNQ